MRRMTEENGARLAVLRQAAFFPEEGLSYEAFLKVLIPSQQAVGRQLLQEGYLTYTNTGGIALSPLVEKNCPHKPTWDESTRVFLKRLIASLMESVSNYLDAQEWAEQAKAEPERLRMLVFRHSRETDLSPLQLRLAKEALLLFSTDEIPVVLPKAKRAFLTEATIWIEQMKGLALLRKQTLLIVPTLENVLEQTDYIPEQHLYQAYEWLAALYIILEDHPRAHRYVDKWQLLRTASSPSFEAVEAGLGTLYDPRAGDQTLGAVLKRWKEEHHEE